MENELSIIGINSLKKRIGKEIELLIQQNLTTENDIKIKRTFGNCFEYDVSFKNHKDNKYYKFVISHNYPFNSPTVFINEKSVMLNHYSNNSDFRNSLKKYTGYECFCCETILCGNNWDPSCTITRALDDINKFRDARRQVIVRIIVDVIKRKYLINDTNIIEWLY